MSCVFKFSIPPPPNTANCSNWSYNSTDDGWADLCPAYYTCSPEYGHSQSPINLIVDDTIVYDLVTPLQFTNPVEVEVANAEFENTGHLLEIAPLASANFSLGDFLITGGPLFAEQYSLQQFHFHTPSEHHLNGVIYDVEFHFVLEHISTDDVAVISQLFQVGPSDNPWVASFLNGSIPTTAGSVDRPVLVHPFQNLLDENGNFAFWYYSGSLTTPPCTQGIIWLISQVQSYLSIDQLNAMHSGVAGGRDARNIQPLNGRLIYNVPGAPIEQVPPPCPSPTPCPTCPTGPAPCGGHHHGHHEASTNINFYFADMVNSAK